MSNSMSFEIKDKVGFIGFGLNAKSKMNVLDVQTLTDIKEIMGEVKKKIELKELQGLVFFSHSESCFIAGADIKLIRSLSTSAEGIAGAEQGQIIYNLIEDLNIPTIACVHGPCLGGGLELALACDQIICSDDGITVLGLPEVRLGLVPGFGGTYRLPKKVGLVNALDMILTGKHLSSYKAKKNLLVEEVYPKERLLVMALKHLKKPKVKKFNLKNAIQDNFITRRYIFQKARENIMQKTKGFYHAPLKIIDLIESGFGKSRSSYLGQEAEAFGDLCVGDQSKNLVHLFFLMEEAKKYSGPKAEGKVPELKRGAVLGAGTMGGGIAWLMAEAEMSPLMKDISWDSLEIGLKQSSDNFMGKMKRKKITQDEFERKQRSISPQLDYKGFKNVDMVIEAIVEDLEVKKKVFAELEKQVRDDCVLVSNTSSLKISDIVEALKFPERFAGLHFFNPVNRMPLVEIVTHDKVAPEIVETLHNWVLRAKKTPVIVKDGPGFLVNRILIPYINEASYLLMEGAPFQDVEKACLNFGMPMGPGRLLDEIGLDVAEKVGKILHAGLGDRVLPNNLSKQALKMGLLGKKNGRGFYLYNEQGKEIDKNTEIQGFLPKKKIKMDEVTIQMRVFLPMINEASLILEEGLVEGPGTIDLALIFGIGFPPFRGGLLRYADFEGLDKIVGVMERFSEEVSSERYAPSKFLKKLCAESKKFYN